MGQHGVDSEVEGDELISGRRRAACFLATLDDALDLLEVFGGNVRKKLSGNPLRGMDHEPQEAWRDAALRAAMAFEKRKDHVLKELVRHPRDFLPGKKAEKESHLVVVSLDIIGTLRLP